MNAEDRLARAVFVTGNAGKLQEAVRLAGVSLRNVDVDLPEIQSLDLAAVLTAKADEAWRQVGGPLIVEETGFELDGLNGFPGPLIKWMLEAIGPEGVAQAALDNGNPRATARCRILLRDERGDVTAEGVTHGRLVLPARGPHGFGWDPVFQPEDNSQSAPGELTYGELSDLQKDQISHRGRAWQALLEQLRREEMR